MRRSLSDLLVRYMPFKATQVCITLVTAREAAEERASFLRSRFLPPNFRERQLGGVVAGVLYGLDLPVHSGPIAALMRSERSQVAVLNGGAVEGDVSCEGCKGAAGYAVARVEDDLRAFYALDQPE